MQSTALRVYTPPRLKVYGTVLELTLTSTSRNKNDAVQGQNNLKT